MKQKLIFDNSNLNESYSGVTTPLTFSFTRRVYSNVYKEFSRVVGTPEEKIRENWPMYDAMLAFICGRMYYNLLNWYKLISFIPGYRFNKEFLEKMLGVTKGVSYDPRSKVRGLKKFIELGLLTRQVVVLLYQFAFINKNVQAFLNEFDKEFKRANAVDLTKLSDKELVDFYLFWEQKFSSKWRITIVNDLAVMIATGILRKMTANWLNDKNNILINEYLSNIKNVESRKPGDRLNNILRRIKSNRSFLKLFKTKSETEIIDLIYRKQNYSQLKKLIESYLRDYGDRSPNELKIESKTYRDNKDMFISLIKNQLPNLKYIEQKTHKKPGENITDHLTNLSYLKKKIFMTLVGLSRSYISNRESARLKRSIVFGFARKAFKEFGRRLAEYKYISNGSGIFYLQAEEIIGVFNGTLTSNDLKFTINQRREEYSKWKRIDSPRRVEINRSVYEYELRKLAQKSEAFLRKKKVVKKKITSIKFLKGLTCSNGVNGESVVGEALVLKSFNPKVSYVGKILVTSQTDPGWTPVFTHLKGVIVERGGMLSHAAIVAREFGLPCLTQVDDATDLITNGKKISINVKNGTVERLN